MAVDRSSNVFQFEGFDLPTTTPVPDQVFDVLLHRLSDPELRVLLYIIRRTFGFKKQSDDISLKQMVEGIKTRDGRVLDHGTGVSKPTITKAIKGLVQKGIVVAVRHRSQEKGDEPTTYALRFRNTPVLNPLTRGGNPDLHGGVNELDPQQTVVQETVIQETDIVVDIAQELEIFGIAKSAITKLIQDYPAQYIRGKLEIAKELVAAGSSLVSQNPAGWLRRAIEEDYSPPRTSARHQQRHIRTKRDAKLAHENEAEAEEPRQVKEEAASEPAVTQEYPLEQHSPQPVGKEGLTTEDVWNQALEQLKADLPQKEVKARLACTTLIEVTDTAAWIGVPNRTALAWLERRLYGQIAKAMKGVLGKDLDLQFIAAP
jgi:replication protein O/DnaA-like protein